MWEWLIIIPVVGLAAFTLARRFWRVGKTTQSGCGCSGCAGGQQCSGGQGRDQNGPCCGC